VGLDNLGTSGGVLAVLEDIVKMYFNIFS